VTAQLLEFVCRDSNAAKVIDALTIVQFELRPLVTNPFTSDMKTAPGESSEGRFT
jgi:hypothetical protein